VGEGDAMVDFLGFTRIPPINPDYRGEIHIILANLGGETFVVERGQRIAQLVVAPVSRVAFDEVAALPESGRGAGGFGSTGQ
jgi:dUTP pyrophosphatase